MIKHTIAPKRQLYKKILISEMLLSTPGKIIVVTQLDHKIKRSNTLIIKLKQLL